VVFGALKRRPAHRHELIAIGRETFDALALSVALAGELRDADAAILAVPLYNFGVSQHFKVWADLVIAGAGAATPLLTNTPTLLVTNLGGGYGPGTPREGWDHSTPYLERILADVWEADLTVIKRELTLAASTPGMESLKDLAEEYPHQGARRRPRRGTSARRKLMPGATRSPARGSGRGGGPEHAPAPPAEVGGAGCSSATPARRRGCRRPDRDTGGDARRRGAGRARRLGRRGGA